MPQAEPSISVTWVWGRRETTFFLPRKTGFEPGIKRRKFAGMKDVSAVGVTQPHGALLASYPEFSATWPYGYLDDDVEAEHSTWPEIMDQTRLARFCTAEDFDDAEEDDACGGDINDEYQDACEEDGI